MFFHPMDFLIMIAFGLSIWAQFKVKGSFKKWSEVSGSSGLTGGFLLQAAKLIGLGIIFFSAAVSDPSIRV